MNNEKAVTVSETLVKTGFIKMYNGWAIYRDNDGKYYIQPKRMNAEFDNTKRFNSMNEVKRFINSYR